LVEKFRLSDAEWRKRLDPETYEVTRRKGTERSCTSPLLLVKEPGVFSCVCCGTPLFDTRTKFESGTGWPSFFNPVTPDALELHQDISHGMQRTEVTCARCDAHLGHVFPDGPPPSGLRYCMNGLALSFEKAGEKADR
jgi:peptide-methionine (R)-S-oxide reductase